MIWILAGAVLLPSFFVSLIAVAIVRRFAVRLRLLDQPNARKVHSNPVPLGGGLGIWCGLFSVFTVGSLIVHFSSPEMLNRFGLEVVANHLEGMRQKSVELWSLLTCAFVLVAVGLMDDRRGLSWQIRIGIEFIVAAIVVFGLDIRFTAFIQFSFLSDLASMIWIVALINSFNMLDNMDGLSGGVAAIICFVLSIMLLFGPGASAGQPQIFVACMLLALLGSLLGFLCHNWPPAGIFMGDAGSYLVGFWIAIATLLTTYTGYHSDTPHAILAPLCALAIPLYDTFSVIAIRLSERRSPFQADKKHFSHRLVEMGLSKRAAVLTIYLATLTTALGALLLQRTDVFGAVVVVLIVICTCGLMAILELLAVRDRSL